ncbi:MAG: acetoacetate decarboxylase family protein [Deltaproteobacteria bacterium]|nr:acetoacetate decarboxylase family protein [Deltaproteobacteria bacterium]
MESDKFNLKGFSLPFTPHGRSSLVEPPPWYYGGEVIQIVFRTRPEQAQRFIPRPLELGPDPGLGIVWFVEWVSVSESNPDLAFINPERSVYPECIVMLQCRFKEEIGYFVPYIWVNNDFTLLRGFIQGFPKKLARIHMTKLSAMNPLVGGRRVGAKVKGICEANAERLVEGSLIFTGQADQSELPKLKFYLLRHYPDLANPSQPLVHELVNSVSELTIADIWRGDAELKFFESAIDEVAALAPVQVLEGFYQSVGLITRGATVIHRYPHQG